MKEWKVGDKIEILRGESDFYDVGTTGILVEKHDEDMWEVDFSGSETGWYYPLKDNRLAVMTWRFDLSVEEHSYDW